MRTSKLFRNILCIILFCSFDVLFAVPLTNQPDLFQTGWVVEEHLKRFAEIGDRWKAGQTNLSLFSVQYFGPWDVVADSSVTKDGRYGSGCFTARGSKGWSFGQLDTTNLSKLQTLIDSLPPSASQPIPVRRRLLISGTRSNSWYSFTYDRADVPIEVERICSMVQGIIVWLPPSTTNCTHTTQITNGAVNLLTNAPSISLAGAIGFGNGGGNPIIISPDGKVMILGNYHKIVASDLRSKETLWTKLDPIRDRGFWLSTGAVVDDGKSVAVALADRIEMWSLKTGEFRSVLDTNSVPYHHLMKASRDGSVLAADLGGGHIKIWTSPWTNSFKELLEHQWTTLLEMSPDGSRIALHDEESSPGPCLIIHDLKNGTRQSMPFRGCYNRDADFAAWSPDGKYLAVGMQGQWPCIYETTSWKPFLVWRVFNGPQHWSGGPTVRLGWGKDGELFAICGDGVLHGLKFPVVDAELDRDFPVD